MLSKISLTIRASIMLITLIGIPLIAMFGKTLSEVGQGWWRGRDARESWQARPTKPVEDPSSSAFKDQLALQSMRKDLTTAPQAPEFDTNRFTATPPTSSSALAPRSFSSERSLAPQSFGQSNLAPPNVSSTPAMNPPSMGASPFNSSHSSSPSVAASSAPNTQPPALLPLDMPQAQKLSSSPTSSGTLLQPIAKAHMDRAVAQAGFQELPRRAAQPETFDSLQQRMKELGATYYKLESASGLYHFFCQVAGPGRAAQDFRASNSDPMAAMRDVAQQLESLNYRTANETSRPASLQPVR